MITRNDLINAIEKCQGQKNPTASTCIKLASYYIILDHLLESDRLFNNKPKSEFLSAVKGKAENGVLKVMDDLMAEVKEIDSELYYSTINKIHDL